MVKKNFFGTDGIRGSVGKAPITPDFAIKLGFAVGQILTANQSDARVVIGKDTRRSCYMLESALQAGLTAAGIDVYLLGPMPTPAVAYLTRAFRASCGIVISASHNLHYDNGIKFFTDHGEKFSDQLELSIEAKLNEPITVVDCEHIGKVFHIHDAPGRYIEFCKSSLPHFSNFQGVKVVLDCAHGATYHVAPNLFRELGASVHVIGAAPNGLNINLDCGSTAPRALSKAVQEVQADIGIAFDGDGDRVIMVDAAGEVVDGDEILYILAMHAKENNLLGQGGVVGTQMSNLGLEHALAAAGIPFLRALVGDRHVMSLLREKNWYLGGESSGHIIWLNSTTTGDGLVSALQVVMIMLDKKLCLRDLLSGMKKYPQVLENIPLKETLSEAKIQALNTQQKIISEEIGNNGRVLVRLSGTEPLLRVMVESHCHELTRQICDRTLAVVTEIISR